MKKKDDENLDDLLDKINTLFEEEVEKIQNDETISQIETSDARFEQTKNEIRKSGLENKLKHLDVSYESTVATNLIKINTLEISAKNLFDIIDELVLSNPEFKEKKTVIDYYKKEKEEEQKEEKLNYLKTKNQRFDAFWYKWTNIKEAGTNSKQYQIDGNNASVSNDIINVSVYKGLLNDIKSIVEAEVVFTDAKKEISTHVKLQEGNNSISGSTVAKGVLHTSLKNVGGEKGISFGVNIKANRIDMYAWNENDNTRLINNDVSIDFTDRNVQVKIKISVDGSKLTASVLPVINGNDNTTKKASKIFDLSRYFLNTEDQNLKITSAKIKAQVGEKSLNRSVRLQVMNFETTKLD